MSVRVSGLGVGISGLGVGILGLLHVRVDGLSLRVGLGGIAGLLAVSSRVIAGLRKLHRLGLVGDVLLSSSLHDDDLLAAGRPQATPDPPAKEKGDGHVATGLNVPLPAESEHEAHVGDPSKAADDNPRDALATAIHVNVAVVVVGI